MLALSALFFPDNLSVEKTYPSTSGGRPPVVELGFKPGDDNESAAAIDLDNKREVELSLPITVGTIEKNRAIRVDFARAAIQTENGEHYRSHWQSQSLTWLPGETSAIVRLKVSRPFFERVKTAHLRIDLSLALTVVQMGKATRSIVLPREFPMPEGSICAQSSEGATDLSCRSPLRWPHLTLIVTRFSTRDCSEAGTASDGDAGMAWFGNLDPDPAEFGITSVWANSLFFAGISRGEATGHRQYLCPGSPLVFLPYTPVERTQQTLTTQAIGLEHLITKLAM